MAHNSLSRGCPSASAFDKYLKDHYFPTFDIASLTIRRGLFEDICNKELKLEDHFKKENVPFAEDMRDMLSKALPEDWNDRIDSIISTLKDGKSLGKEQKEFLNSYASAVSKFQTLSNFQSEVRDRAMKAGIMYHSVTSQYRTFKNAIPPKYRLETQLHVADLIIGELDYLSEQDNLTIEEVLEEYGFDNIISNVHTDLLDDIKEIENPSEEQKQMFKALERPEVWESCVFLAKSILFDAEKIKIGLNSNYLEALEEEDEDTISTSDEEIHSAETEGPEHWMLKTDTMSAFFGLSREARKVLYHIHYEDKTNVFGKNSIVETMKTFKDLMAIRAGKSLQNSDEFISAIAASEYSWKDELVELLNKDNRIRTIFFNAFRKNSIDYVYVNERTYRDGESANRRGGTYWHRNTLKPSGTLLLNTYAATVYDIEDESMCLFNADGSIKIREAGEFRNFIRNHFLKGSQVINTEGFIEGASEEENKRAFIITAGLRLNLHLSKAEIDSLMEDKDKYRNFCISIDDVIGSRSIFALNGKGAETIKDHFGNNAGGKSLKRLLTYSKEADDYSDRLTTTENSIRYNKGTYYAMTVPNNLGDILERFQHAYSIGQYEGLKSYIEKEYLWSSLYATKNDDGSYTIHNEWLKQLYDAASRKDDTFIKKFLEGSVTRGLGISGKPFEDFSEKDNHLFCMNEFFTEYAKSDGKYGTIPLFVTGDSNATRFLPVKAFKVADIKKKMVDVAIQEIQRMQVMQSYIEFLDNPDNIDKNSPDYATRRKLKLSNGHAGRTIEEWMREPEDRRPAILRYANKFSFLTELNDKAEDLLESYRIKSIDEFKAELQEEIKNLLETGYSNFLDDLSDKKILYNEVVGSNKRRVSGNIRPSVLSIEGLELTPTHLQEYYYNYKYNMIQQLQFFTVDTSFYEGTQDLQKRYKEMIAAGDPLDLAALDITTGEKVDDNDGNQDALYFDEIIINLADEGKGYGDKAYMNALEAHKKGLSKEEQKVKDSKINKYTKNTLTDGQGYRTFKSYRKICIMRGIWTPQMEAVYNLVKEIKAVNNNSELSEKEKDDRRIELLKKIESYNVIFQPLKPFYFGFEKVVNKDGNGVTLVPVQHKYSEFPIIPELLPKGHKLAQFGLALEQEGYDLACCTTCVKVGGFGSVNIHSTEVNGEYKELTTVEDYKNAFKGAYRHKLPLQGWRQQSNVPEHVNNSRAVGTQLLKHGFMCLADSHDLKEYPFLKAYGDEIRLTKEAKLSLNKEGRKGITAAGIIQLYNALVGSGYMKASIALSKKITNPKEFSNLLSELRIMDSRGAKDNIEAYTLDEDGKILLSPAEGITGTDNMASLLSRLRKDVIKRPVKGGSFVQVSGFGFENDLKVKTKGNNIKYAECAVPFALSVTDENGNQIPLNYFEYVDPNTGQLLGLDGKATDPEDSDDTHAYYGWNTKLGRDFPGILDLIAYRIPTEKAYSVINLKVKRFLPKTAGGVIMVPSQYTTVAGFDFDIDKLYFIRREYKMRRLTDVEKNVRNARIWNDIYGKHNRKSKGTSAVYKALAKAREEALAEHKESLEGEGEVVASSTQDTNNTLGAAFSDQFAKLADSILGTEETAEEESEQSKEAKAEAKEVKSSNYENMRLFQFWDRADFSGTEAEGMTAEEYFTKWVSNHIGRYKNLVSYAKDKTIMEQSQIVANNLMFDLYQARLEDEDTFDERYTPGGFQQLKDEKYIMLFIQYAKPEEWKDINSYSDLVHKAKSYKNRNPEYNATEPQTLAHYQTKNAMYDKLIGVAANQNINMRLTALLRTLKLKEPILFGSLIETSKKDSGAGCDVKKRKIGDQDTELLSTEFLAASVDAVKDALLEYYGMDDNNFNIACLLAKIGATPADIGLLLNQPVVQMAMESIRESKGNKNLSYALDDAIHELCKKYNKDYEELTKEADKEFGGEKGRFNRQAYVTSNALTEGLKPTKGSNFVKQQYAVVNLMEELNTAASELSDEVNISKATSTNSVKSTYGSLEALVQRAKAFLLSFGKDGSKFVIDIPENVNGEKIDLINPRLLFTSENADSVLESLLTSPFCIEQVAFSSILNFMRDLEYYFPYGSPAFQVVKNTLAGITTKGYLSDDVFNSINKDMMCFLLERMVTLFNGDAFAEVPDPKSPEKTINTGIPKRMFYNIFFPEYFSAVMENNKKLKALGKNDLIDYSKIPLLNALSQEVMGVSTGKERSFRPILKVENGGNLVNYQKDDFIESWETMFFSEDPILRNLASDLFLYSFFSNGFDFSISSVMHLAPVALKIALGDGEYKNFFNRIFNMRYNSITGALEETTGDGKTSAIDNINIGDMIKSFILNHFEEYPQFAKTVLKSEDEYSLYQAIIKKIYPEEDMKEVEKQKEKGYSLYYDSDKFLQSFTVDINSKDFSASPFDKIVTYVESTDRDGAIDGVRFTPCIVINGAVYICDINSNYATTGKSSSEFYYAKAAPDGSIPVMTYYRMQIPYANADYSTPKLYASSEENAVESQQASNNMKTIIMNARTAYKETKEVGKTGGADNKADEGEGTVRIVNWKKNITDLLLGINVFRNNYSTAEGRSSAVNEWRAASIIDEIMTTSPLSKLTEGEVGYGVSDYTSSIEKASLSDLLDAYNYLKNTSISDMISNTETANKKDTKEASIKYAEKAFNETLDRLKFALRNYITSSSKKYSEEDFIKVKDSLRDSFSEVRQAVIDAYKYKTPSQQSIAFVSNISKLQKDLLEMISNPDFSEESFNRLKALYETFLVTNSPGTFDNAERFDAAIDKVTSNIQAIGIMLSSRRSSEAVQSLEQMQEKANTSEEAKELNLCSKLGSDPSNWF